MEQKFFWLRQDLDLMVVLEKAFAGDRRRGGEPALLHSLRVARAVPMSLRRVALAHDLLEDHPELQSELSRVLSSTEFAMVRKLTRTPDESYGYYMERVLRDPLTATIKMADMLDNLRGTPTEEKRAKYMSYLPLLAESVLESLANRS